MARLGPAYDRLGAAPNAGRYGQAISVVNFVLDTNAVSETEKPRPNAGYMAWLGVIDPANLFITTITLAEVWQGFFSLEPNHPDRKRIMAIATELPRRYRILNFDRRSAVIWGQLTRKGGDPLPLRDSLIGAIAKSRGFQIVSRDVAPFTRMDCKVISPWT